MWYYESAAFLEDTCLIRRKIGIAHQIGQAMCYWILPQSGILIVQTIVQNIMAEELK